jgi:DNA-binding IclR family transcriptional regulator
VFHANIQFSALRVERIADSVHMVDNGVKPEWVAGARPGGQAIRRAIAVLRILAAGGETGLPLGDVVDATGLTRPTVHRIVQVLIEEGVVERHGKTGRYAIGGQVGELALARRSRLPLLSAADVVLSEASSRIGDTLFLTVRTGNDTLCVDRRVGSYPIQVLSIEVGARRPLGVSSAGVAILAAMSARDARKIVTANAPRFAAYRTTASAILTQIAGAQRRGYSLREVGLVRGTKSISTWIESADARPAAAITLSAVETRLGSRREQEIAEILLRAAHAIEQNLRLFTRQTNIRYLEFF